MFRWVFRQPKPPSGWNCSILLKELLAFAVGGDCPPIRKTTLANTAKMSLSEETFYTDASFHLAALENNFSTSHTSSIGILTAFDSYTSAQTATKSFIFGPRVPKAQGEAA